MNMEVKLVLTPEQVTEIASKMLELSSKNTPETVESKEVLLKVKDVAEMLNITEQTVRKHIKDGLLKTKRVNNSIRISNKEIERYAKQT